MKYISNKLKLKPWQKIIVALISGTITGLLLGKNAVYLKPIGSLFINAINMMIVPVVFTAIVCAVISMDDLKTMRRIGIKAFILYTISMAIAACIGLCVATYFSPGAGLINIHFENTLVNITKAPTFLEAITNIVPANPVAAFASGNILQILVFAIVLGISINLAGEPAKPVAHFFRSFATVTIKLTQVVMRFAPYGIFSLMAYISGEYGLTALVPLIKLVFTIYLSCILLALLFYALTIASFVKINPTIFFKSIRDAMLFAFSTSSSAATLPITMRCAEENLGISKKISGFLLPLGTTMNLNGLAIYLSVATVFAANMHGVDLSFPQYFTIILSIILTSMGAGGIPGSGIIVMGAVMSSIGLPLTAINLIVGVDRLNDMAQTTTNVTGDLYAALIIAKGEGELNRDVLEAKAS